MHKTNPSYCILLDNGNVATKTPDFLLQCHQTSIRENIHTQRAEIKFPANKQIGIYINVWCLHFFAPSEATVFGNPRGNKSDDVLS